MEKIYSKIRYGCHISAGYGVYANQEKEIALATDESGSGNVKLMGVSETQAPHILYYPVAGWRNQFITYLADTDI